MDFMSIFLLLAILRSHFSELMPSDVMLPADFSVQERDQCVELLCYGGLKNDFKKGMLCNFLLKRRAEYGLISGRALQFLIPFSMS